MGLRNRVDLLETEIRMLREEIRQRTLVVSSLSPVDRESFDQHRCHPFGLQVWNKVSIITLLKKLLHHLGLEIKETPIQESGIEFIPCVKDNTV